MTHADDFDAWLDRAVPEFLDSMAVKDLIRTCRGKDESGIKLAVARHDALGVRDEDEPGTRVSFGVVQ